MSMVEKVAKAIYQKAVDQRPLTPLGLDADWPTWDELADKDRNYALGEARAAIEAMMEPTPDRFAVAALDLSKYPAGTTNTGILAYSVLAERNRCISIAQSIEPHNEAEAHLIETIVRKMRGDE